jgi:hypothetical protein
VYQGGVTGGFFSSDFLCMELETFGPFSGCFGSNLAISTPEKTLSGDPSCERWLVWFPISALLEPLSQMSPGEHGVLLWRHGSEFHSATVPGVLLAACVLLMVWHKRLALESHPHGGVPGCRGCAVMCVQLYVLWRHTLCCAMLSCTVVSLELHVCCCDEMLVDGVFPAVPGPPSKCVWQLGCHEGTLVPTRAKKSKKTAPLGFVPPGHSLLTALLMDVPSLAYYRMEAYQLAVFITRHTV